MILTTNDLYDLFEGGERVLANTKFMRRGFEESDTEFNERLTWASYVNYQKKIINTYLSYIFYGEVTVEPSTPLPLEDIARKLAKHALIGGEAYALETEGNVHVYDKRQVTCNNGVYVIGSKGISTKIDTINKTITGLKRGSTTEIITEKLKDGRFVICRWNDDGTSLIADTAMLNLQIFNFQSILDAHYNRSLYYLLYGPNLGPGKKNPSPRSYIPVNKDEVAPGVLLIDSPATDKVRSEIDRRKMDMAITVGLEQEFSDVTKVESGVARAIKMLDTNAIVSSAAYFVQHAVNQVAEYHAKEYKHDVQTIKFSPLLNVVSQDEEYAKYKFLLEFCGTDEVAKEVQAIALRACSGSKIDPKRMDLLVKDIQKNGGRKIYESSAYVGH
jgi:hypothetical protein